MVVEGVGRASLACRSLWPFRILFSRAKPRRRPRGTDSNKGYRPGYTEAEERDESGFGSSYLIFDMKVWVLFVQGKMVTAAAGSTSTL